MKKTVSILFVVAFVSMLVCVIPVTAQENSLDITLTGSPEKLSPGELITYDIWYNAQVSGDWCADHIWVFFTFDPRIEIISAPMGLVQSGINWWGDFTPGLQGNGWLSDLIGGTFVGKIKSDTVPGSIIKTTAEIWNCLEENTADKFDRQILSATSTSLTPVEEPIPAPEFPNPVPVILSSAGMLAVVLVIKAKQ